MPHRLARGAALLAALLAPALLRAQSPRPLSFLDVQRLRSAQDPDLSPDGRAVLYALSEPDWQAARSTTDLYLVPVEEGPAGSRRLTFTKDKSESNPTWGPDGSFFVFRSDREGSGANPPQQLYLMRVDGGEAQRFTDAKDGVADFRFTRDGRWLIYAAGKPEERRLWVLPADSLATAKPAPLTREHAPVRAWLPGPDGARVYFTVPDTVDQDNRKRVEQKFTVWIRNELPPREHLWTVDLATRAERRLTGDTTYSVSGVTLSRDGRWIGFRGTLNNRYLRTVTESAIYGDAYLLETATGRIERLTENSEVAESPVSFSPDGSRLAIAAPNEWTGGFKRSSQQFVEDISRCPPRQGLTGPGVQVPGNAVELPLGERRQVDAPREVLPEQPVRVLGGAPLPRTARVTEVDLDAGGYGERLVLGHLLALIPRHAAAQLGRQRTNPPRQRAAHLLGRAALRQPLEQHVATLALDQGRHCRLSRAAEHEIAFPVAWHGPIRRLRGAGGDHHHPLQPTGRDRTSLRPPLRSPRAQILRQRPTQGPAPLDEQGSIDRLVRHPHLRIARVVEAKPRADLLRRPPALQPGDDNPAQPLPSQLRDSRPGGGPSGALVRVPRSVVQPRSVPPDLAGNGRGSTPQLLGNLTTGGSRREPPRNLLALRDRKLPPAGRRRPGRQATRSPQYPLHRFGRAPHCRGGSPMRRPRSNPTDQLQLVN